MLVDTHAHLQWPSFDVDREKVVARAREKGITRIVNVGFDVEGSMRGVRLSEKHEGLYAAVGIHPHSANQFVAKTVDTLRELANNPKVLAIGEVGLDYYRNLSPRETQKKAFETQLALAQELRLPVIVHDRDAHDEVIEILTRFKGKIKGVMHCFSGSREMAEQCLGLGFLVSFGGTVTYPNASRVREIAKWIDLKRLLLETDCPWLAPQNMRGRRNEPSFLPLIAERIAGLKGIATEDLAEATCRNAEEVFGLPEASRLNE